ncbi:hypothetical protein FY133_00495 [Agrobacterium tumefaciens]|uniref:hypothetical protein n=1 Tax=Agrobacterium tumefaciens TaxID=358 RepID=UPI0021CE25C7|nr:hypothetical protein [Agrobacterium tumefaciens]UXT64131.1 hypothetical protein FY133_00495 [Agrobacterium tumefaciens]
MAVLTPFSVKTIREAVNGELVMFPDELGGELAIKCGQDEYGYSFLAVLKSAESGSPYATKVQGEAECLSYGVSWLIEVDRVNSFSRSQEVAESAGSIHLSKSGPVMRFAGDHRAGFTGMWLDLVKNSPASHPYDAPATNRWRLWLDEKDRNNPKADPFLIFPLPPKAKA